MNKLQVANEAHFKKAARKAILAIVFFALSYLTLLALAVAFAIACGYAAMWIFSLSMGAISLGFGLGVIILGVIVVIFLIKFIFKRHVVDRSHLIELEEHDAPLLYQEIRNIVAQVKTSFPKRIYLSADVNAAVFYDSNVLSMFLPIRKNLQIGLGLVNSFSQDELRVILAHEFGHFSQKSMKVGSYVYTVNQIIFNMLYDNDNYNRGLEGIGQFSYFTIFTFVGLKIIAGIQWLLIKLYGVVNINHMGLSREMEFHADAIAAHTVGTQVFTSSLLRSDLAHHAFDEVITYYEKKASAQVKPKNIYPQQHFLMKLLAEESNIPVNGHFPLVPRNHFSKHNKSKLVFKDQWSSHPSREDRISAIEKYNFDMGKDNGVPANEYFADIESLQEMVTNMLFPGVNYKHPTVDDDIDTFKQDFVKNRSAVSFPKVFNGYYDYHNPGKVDLDNATVDGVVSTLADFFSDDRVDLIYSLSALRADISILQEFQIGEGQVKSFEYDGKRHTLLDVELLLAQLTDEERQLETKIAVNDLAIFQNLKKEAATLGRTEALLEKYIAFVDFDLEYDKLFELYFKAINETNFIQVTTPFEEIKENFIRFKHTEKQLKAFLKERMLNDNLEVDDAARLAFETYLSEDLTYFIHSVYKEENLAILFNALNKLSDVLNRNYLLKKQTLLIEMETVALQSNKLLVEG